MSRIGKKPVAIPAGVTASMGDGTLSVKGPKGELTMPMSDLISYEMKDEGLSVMPANKSKEARAFWGMQRTLVQNLVTGVTEGFTKVLEITGVGTPAAASTPPDVRSSVTAASRATRQTVNRAARPAGIGEE